MAMLSLDYVSPLPPVRSGIADYSLDLLPELGKRCDLRLVRLPGQEVDPEIAKRWPVIEVDRLGEGGRLPLYQMGNNRYHEAVDQLARKVPGVLTLHDVVLHHLLIDRTVNRDDFKAYREGLGVEHGWIGRAASMPLRWPGGYGNALQFSLPAHRTLLSAQKGVVVHSVWSAGWLKEELPFLRVRALPMGIPLPAIPDAELGRDFRQRHGIPLDVPLLGSFGFQTPMKRTEVAIEALSSPCLSKAHLMVAGELAPILELEKKAREAGVEHRVHFLGFLPFSEFEAAIAAADVCLNLRYPTAGETSASLLRILALGRCAVVSDYGPSADLPDDVVVKVPLGEGEVDVLSRRLAVLLEEPSRLRSMGERAREHVREVHPVPLAAELMVEACAEWRDREACGLRELDVREPTSLAWDRLDGTLEVRGAGKPWRPGERRRLEICLKNTGRALWLAGEREGGVAVEVQLWAGDQDLRAGQGWIGLPFDLAPGEEHRFQLDLRRPLEVELRLCILPHVLAHDSFPVLGGPSWSAVI